MATTTVDVPMNFMENDIEIDSENAVPSSVSLVNDPNMGTNTTSSTSNNAVVNGSANVGIPANAFMTTVPLDSQPQHFTSVTQPIHVNGVWNNWTPNNENTVKHWKNEIKKSTYIYEFVLEKNKKALNKINLAALIISSVSALLSLSQLGISEQDYEVLSLVFKALLVLMTTTLGALNSAIKIYGFNDTVERLTQYIERLDNFYGKISSQAFLPARLREDALEFIKRENETFMGLTIHAPAVESSDHRAASNQFSQMENNLNPDRFRIKKYVDDDAMLDSV